MHSPIPIKMAPAPNAGYLEHANLESELEKLPVHAHFLVEHIGGQTVQPFTLVIPATCQRSYWVNMITGTLHDQDTGESLSGNLRILFKT